METDTKTLCEIPKKYWAALRDLYKKDWPKHHIAYYTIQNYIDWMGQDPNIKNIKILSLNDHWEDGTFIILDRYSCLANTLSDNLDNLVTALDTLDKSKYYFIYGITENIIPAIVRVFEKNNWPCDLKENDTVWYCLDKKLVNTFEIVAPQGVVLNQLSEQNAELVNAKWPHRHPGSLNMLKRLIKYNHSVGAFKQDTGELIAWCLRTQLGSLGILQVSDEFKRQGYGSLMVKAMSKYICEQGKDVYAPVIAANTASQNMFEKIGFKEFGRVNVLVTKSNDPTYVWNDNDD